MSHPKPDLQIYPRSGLSFPWAEDQTGHGKGTGSMHLGPDGVGLGMSMFIYWEDLEDACTQLLGYSYRDTSVGGVVTGATNANPVVITTQQPHGLATGQRVQVEAVTGNTAANGGWIVTVLTATTFSIPPQGNGAYAGGGNWYIARMRRAVPWQHPYWNQSVVKALTQVQGWVLQGTSELAPAPFPVHGGGQADYINSGPWSEFYMAQITISFWRPPYYVLSDSRITDGNGIQQEWLRYVDKGWEASTQMLSRENATFSWIGDLGIPQRSFQGSVGQAITHHKVSKRWYQLPEACCFQTVNSRPDGLPLNFTYTQTRTTNPITGYIYQPGSPIGGTVNSPIGGGVSDSNTSNRMWGQYMGTMCYHGVTFEARPLQLPPYLMAIPQIAGNEALSQVQYDAILHYDIFDPPRSAALMNNVTALASGAITNQAARGHNLMPYSADGQWYPVQTTNAVIGTATKATPFHYADPSDPFRSL